MKISLRGIGKSFLDDSALDDIDLDIESGELIAVVGTNGAGKTTILKILATLLSTDEGEVRMDGELLTHRRIDLRSRLHFLEESPVLLGSTIDHICRVVHLYDRELPGLKEKILSWLREFELMEVAHRYGLSRGQKYKAAFVGICAANPELWLLDEPFAAGVDPTGISAMKRAINKAVGSGSTVVYSTQIVELAETFSDRILVMNRGKIELDIPTKQLKEAQHDNALARLFENLRMANCK